MKEMTMIILSNEGNEPLDMKLLKEELKDGGIKLDENNCYVPWHKLKKYKIELVDILNENWGECNHVKKKIIIATKDSERNYRYPYAVVKTMYHEKLHADFYPLDALLGPIIEWFIRKRTSQKFKAFEYV